MNFNQIKEVFPTVNKFFCYKMYKYKKEDFCIIMKKIKSDISIFDGYAIDFVNQIKSYSNEIDIFTSVPKFESQKNEFDFAKHLAKILADKLNKPYIENIVVKTKETKKIRTLDYSLRKKEISNAFEVFYKDTTKKICIVDDVIASGSTLKEIVDVLNKNNFSNISLSVLIMQDYE